MPSNPCCRFNCSYLHNKCTNSCVTFPYLHISYNSPIPYQLPYGYYSFDERKQHCRQGCNYLRKLCQKKCSNAAGCNSYTNL